jgi:hypothetical protein
MTPDLEAIVAADEEARARVAAAQEAAQASVRAALDARQQQREARYEALRQATDDDQRRIREEADRAVADREAIRARYRETRRRMAEGMLTRAAEVFATIVANGPPGTPR